MEILIAVLSVIVVLLVIAEYFMGGSSRGGGGPAPRVWARVARRLHLTWQATGVDSAGAIFGDLDGVTVRAVDRRPKQRGMHVIATPSGWLPDGFMAGPRDTVIEGAGPRVITGDEELDGAVRLHGDALVVAGMLDHTRRRRLLEAVTEHGMSVESGGVFWWSDEVPADRASLERAITRAAEVAEDLAYGEKAPNSAGLLLRNLLDDPDVAVRRRSLMLLFEHDPRSPAARKAAQKALQDADPGIRLEAATKLPTREAFGVMLGILNDPIAGDDLRLKSMGAIGEVVRRLASTTGGGSSQSPGLQAPLVHCLREKGYADPVPPLASLADATEAAPVAAAVARALGRLADARGEEALLRLLKSSSQQVAVEAAAALGRLGGRSALDQLRRLSDSQDSPRALRSAARTAIERIGSRSGRSAAAG